MKRRRDTAFEPTQAELEQAEFALWARVNLSARVFARVEELLAQLMAPEGRQGDGQQQTLQPLGMPQLGVLQIEAARLVIPKALLDAHASRVFVQATQASRLVGHHDDHLRVFGFAQSVEQAALPVTSFLIEPIAQWVFVPFMTTGAGVGLLGPWFGVGTDRGLALLFTVAGLIGLFITVLAMRSSAYRVLSERYQRSDPPEQELVGAYSA